MLVLKETMRSLFDRDLEESRPPRGVLEKKVKRKNLEGTRGLKQHRPNGDNMTSLTDRLSLLRADLLETKPEQAALIREAIQSLDNQAISIGVLQNRLDIAHKTLDRYADPVFWLRLPPSTFATADKGQMAKQALQDMVDDHNA